MCAPLSRYLTLLLCIFLLQLVSGIRGMVQRRELFSELLRVVEHMKTFITHRIDGEEELRVRLEQSETDLVAARKVAAEKAKTLKKSEEEREALRIQLEGARKREESSGPSLRRPSKRKPS